jgi:hypothetical protein
MEKFDFHLDKKITCWHRTKFEIEAETLEEAKKLAIDYYKNGDLCFEPSEIIDDTFESAGPEELLYTPTDEILCSVSQ